MAIFDVDVREREVSNGGAGSLAQAMDLPCIMVRLLPSLIPYFHPARPRNQTSSIYYNDYVLTTVPRRSSWVAPLVRQAIAGRWATEHRCLARRVRVHAFGALSSPRLDDGGRTAGAAIFFSESADRATVRRFLHVICEAHFIHSDLDIFIGWRCTVWTARFCSALLVNARWMVELKAGTRMSCDCAMKWAIGYARRRRRRDASLRLCAFYFQRLLRALTADELTSLAGTMSQVLQPIASRKL